MRCGALCAVGDPQSAVSTEDRVPHSELSLQNGSGGF